MAHHVTKQAACANCAHAFAPGGPDEFCPRCGQQNHAVEIGIGHVLEEFMEGIFHFDGKVFRTAGLLLFRPGELTRRFLAGHRVLYVPPIRLYVFISFIFFLLLGFLGGRSVEETKGRKEFSAALAEGLREADSSARVEPARLPRPAPSAKQAVAGRRAQAALGGASPADANLASNSLKVSAQDIQKLPPAITAAQVDSVVRSKGRVPGFWNRLTVRRLLRWRDTTREELLHQALRGASVLLFLLMPLAALLLKGAYFRQHRYYLSHLIFTIHVQCFLFVYAAVALLLSRLPLPDGLGAWGVLVPGGYFVVALHTFYGQSWLKTLAKSLLLGTAYSLLMGFCLAAVTVLAVFAF